MASRKEYLVKGHQGGFFYVSSDAPEEIERVCEVCEDSDEIVASWNIGDEKSKIDALLAYLNSKNVINSAEDLTEKIGLFKTYAFDLDDVGVIDSLTDTILDSASDNDDLINSLYKDGHLNEEGYNELIKRNRLNQKMQLEIVMSNLGNYIKSNKDREEVGKRISLWLDFQKEDI